MENGEDWIKTVCEQEDAIGGQEDTIFSKLDKINSKLDWMLGILIGIIILQYILIWFKL